LEIAIISSTGEVSREISMKRRNPIKEANRMTISP
jgi:hypothetical protein